MVYVRFPLSLGGTEEAARRAEAGVFHDESPVANGCPQGWGKTGALSTGPKQAYRFPAVNWQARFMTLVIPGDCLQLIANQNGVISRAQGVEFGLAGEEMRNRVRFADWQRVQRGVYATFSGDLQRETQLRAALLRAGSEAVLSHQTAAELYGLLKQPGPMIHLTVPAASNPARNGRLPGVVVHRSRILEVTRHPVLEESAAFLGATLRPDCEMLRGATMAAFDGVFAGSAQLLLRYGREDHRGAGLALGFDALPRDARFPHRQCF
jgi:hypothetical protein